MYKPAPTQTEIAARLTKAREAGSVQLTGTREERIAQLRELRRKDFAEEGIHSEKDLRLAR
ncbi:hypothetical protein N5923_09775 [Erwiniaceae bacterium BAC15a-03b]|uniref:Uncharacterized protein n=1 Tax=Winslowiella arboricola TaxID=2978220 RepID=A0A9J6PSP6_9GAMM|nr:hypothetical protein [Winslowiella arboricola]MCU5773870.1 hypothetical protein [Winslowiella arboricola]MCU5777780.1 hypothetical protein [Winslowiella arboricola]